VKIASAAKARCRPPVKQFNILRERMTEKLNCAPEELVAIANYGDEAYAKPDRTRSKH